MKRLVWIALFGFCGLVPLKPLLPLGCRDLRPVCVCSSDGNACWYEWVCVP